MNWLNHFIFNTALCLLFLPCNFTNVVLILIFSFMFSTLIDYDHLLNKKAPWYRKRTWLQEPTGLVMVGLPLSFLLARINKIFFILILVPYAGHIFLDYLCIFEAYPLSPFLKIKKREGLGIFIPDSLVKSEVNRKWKQRVKARKIKAISENYFTPFSIAFLIFVLTLSC